MLADILTKAPDFIMFHGCSNFAECEALTKQAAVEHGIDYLPTDAGEWCSPRYGAVRTPQVGDAVSKSFNGDSYPAGEITKISASKRRIETSTGLVFFRKGARASWINNGTWHLVRGHHYEQNPSF